MAVITERADWDELVNPGVFKSTTVDAITGQSLSVDMTVPPPSPLDPTFAAFPNAALQALFPDEKVQATWATKVVGGTGFQSFGGMRVGPEIFLSAGPPQYGFLFALGDFGGAAVVVARFNNFVQDLLSVIPLASRDQLFRATSDDDGAVVRVHFERWNGASFDSLYFGQFADMPGLAGRLYNPFGVFAQLQDEFVIPVAGDKVIFDNITIDSVAVVPPP